MTCNCGYGCPCLEEAERDRDEALALLRDLARLGDRDYMLDGEELARRIAERFPELAHGD